MTADPAIAAAQRAAQAGRLTPGLMIPSESSLEFGVLAAREFAAPLRKLHKRIDGFVVSWCSHCRDEYGHFQDWPCATAKLIYPEDELT
ncbi:hypothetical protein PP506_gp53 [Gordonia phage DobbysSock]|uniref:Uncharacterized protein n=1 Tax=Gordonia phage DobbysSock TaxID=2652880 RepID=A0A5P8DB02_9CAUD|nr:hypothetical protein PP506_gp53 [Gordonia phage DobbysSock]QFP96174.1 hypothetical protein DOBBYSSOCK_SEA_53 [Gordonia phage DobbysSock]